MGILKRLFGGRDTRPPEHAVIVRLRLHTEGFGETDERESIHRLTDELDRAITAAGVGEFDGDEFGAGECTLYMYGPDADSLFAAVEAPLRASAHSAGGTVTKRYGEAADPRAREVTSEL